MPLLPCVDGHREAKGVPRVTRVLSPDHLALEPMLFTYTEIAGLPHDAVHEAEGHGERRQKCKASNANPEGGGE